MNVCVYGPRGARFALRETAIDPSARGGSGVAIGRSSMEWRGDALVATVDERSTPFGAPIRGRVTLHPDLTPSPSVALDAQQAHMWWPVCASGRIEAELWNPEVRFNGRGYHDANAGAAPLEDSFRSWSWSRASLPGSGAVITYDVDDRFGGQRSVAWTLGPGKQRQTLPELSTVALPRTRWRLARAARADRGARATSLRELEDTPFYSRSLVGTTLGGAPVVAMHETLSLERLRTAWVRFLVNFRTGSA